MRILVNLFFLIVVGIPCANANNIAIEIKQDFKAEYIGKYLETYEDVDRSFSMNKVIQSKNWQTQKASKFVYQTAASRLWIKFVISNQTNENQELSLVVEDPLMEQAQFFSFERDKLVDTSLNMGNSFPFTQRSIQHRYPIYAFQLKPNQEKTIYGALVRSNGNIPIHLKLYKQKYLFPALQKDIIGKVLLLSPIFIFTIISFLVLLYHPNIHNLSFVVLICINLLFLLGLEGLGFQYIWPTSISFQRGFPVLYILYLFLISLSLLFFFKLYKKPKLARLVYIVFIIQSLAIPYTILLTTTDTLTSLGGFKNTSYFLLFSSISSYVLLLITCLTYYKQTKDRFIFIAIWMFFFQLLTGLFLSISWLLNIHFQKYITGFEFLSTIVNIQIIVFLLITIITFYKRDTAYKEVEFQLAQKQNEALQNLLKGQENERKRLSRELHDGLSIRMLQVKQGLDMINKNSNKTRFTTVIQQIDEIHQDIRNLSHALNPKVLQEYGLHKAINDIIFNIEMNNPELDIQFEYSQVLKLSKDQEKHFYYILQELLNNTVKYAKANYIYIEFKLLRDKLLLYYFDNGCGYDPTNLSDSGIGLGNIKSRVALLNGVLKILPRKPKGMEHNIYVSRKNPSYVSFQLIMKNEEVNNALDADN